MKPLDWITAALAVVVSVEQALPAVKGETKLQTAVDLLTVGAAVTGQTIPAAAPVTSIINDVVAVLNRHGIFSHKTPAPKTS